MGNGLRAASRLGGEIGYGLPVFGGGFTGTSSIGLGLSDTGNRRGFADVNSDEVVEDERSGAGLSAVSQRQHARTREHTAAVNVRHPHAAAHRPSRTSPMGSRTACSRRTAGHMVGGSSVCISVVSHFISSSFPELHRADFSHCAAIVGCNVVGPPSRQAATRLLRFAPALRVTQCRPHDKRLPWPKARFRPWADRLHHPGVPNCFVNRHDG